MAVGPARRSNDPDDRARYHGCRWIDPTSHPVGHVRRALDQGGAEVGVQGSDGIAHGRARSDTRGTFVDEDPDDTHLMLDPKPRQGRRLNRLA